MALVCAKDEGATRDGEDGADHFVVLVEHGGLAAIVHVPVLMDGEDDGYFVWVARVGVHARVAAVGVGVQVDADEFELRHLKDLLEEGPDIVPGSVRVVLEVVGHGRAARRPAGRGR